MRRRCIDYPWTPTLMLFVIQLLIIIRRLQVQSFWGMPSIFNAFLWMDIAPRSPTDAFVREIG